MKRLIVLFSFALLFASAGKLQAQCGYYQYGPPPVVVYHVHHVRAWIPGYWRWSWKYNRYFWIHGYWY